MVYPKGSVLLAPALATFGDERAIGARLLSATDKMLITPEQCISLPDYASFSARRIWYRS